MSDEVIIAIISGFVSLLTPILVLILNHRMMGKVSAYHKEVNGRMGELIETTKKLGNAEGTADEKARNKTSPKTL